MIKSKSFTKKTLFCLLLSTAIIFNSCKSTPEKDTTDIIPPVNETTEEQITDNENPNEDQIIEEEKPEISRKLLDKGVLTATQLAEYFLSQRPDYDLIDIVHFAQIYIVEAAAENINSDIAFAQMCLETGYLKFGGLVQPEWHNYCGLGAMDIEHPGCIFENEQLGVRAHIQHLQAYATTEDIQLNNELIDPRYSWVHKTKFIETIDGLTGTWATDPNYAIKIDNILCRMEQLLVK